MLLDKYTKYSESQYTTSEGTSFSQKGGDSNKQLPPYDKNIGKIFNALDAYIKFTQNNIVQKQLPIHIVKNEVMTTNLNRVNQVSPPRLERQQV